MIYSSKDHDFRCFINIEPHSKSVILPLHNEVNLNLANYNDSSHWLNMVKKTITMSIYINGNNNSRHRFLSLAINNTNIEISVIISNLTISSFSSNSTSGGAISMISK